MEKKEKTICFDIILKNSYNVGLSEDLRTNPMIYGSFLVDKNEIKKLSVNSILEYIINHKDNFFNDSNNNIKLSIAIDNETRLKYTYLKVIYYSGGYKCMAKYVISNIHII